ncbi:hypothetical protein D3C84_178230 [compost metagenome]
MGGDVDWLRIGCGVAERLHDQVGGEAQARQVFQFVAGHRASGVLGADGGHFWFAVGARTYALANGQAACLADHLLRQGVALAGVDRGFRQLEQVGWAQAQLGACLVGQATADDQRDTAAGADFVQQHRGLHFEGGDNFVGTVLAHLAGVRVQVDHVAHVHVRHIEFDRQGAGVFHGVVEDRGDLGAEAETAAALVRHVRDVVAEEPQYRVGSGFTRRTGTDHVADVGDREALAAHFFDLLHRAGDALLVRHDAVAGHFQHGQGVQRDVRARPGVRGRGQVVGVGFAGDLEYAQADLVGQGRTVLEPLAVGPGLQHGLGVDIAGAGFFGHVVEGIEHQQGVLELFGGNCCQLGIVQQLDHRGDVVTALHGAQQLNGALFIDQGRLGFTLGHGGEETGLDVGGFVHSWWNAVGDQVDEDGFFASRRILQQLDQASCLFGVKRLGHDTQGGTLFDVFAVGFKHSYYPHQWSQMGVRDAHPEIAVLMRCMAL